MLEYPPSRCVTARERCGWVFLLNPSILRHTHGGKNAEEEMLFDWLRTLLYFDKDPDASGGGTDDSSGDDADKKEGSAEDPNAGDDKDKAKAKEEKVYSKAETELIVEERLKRERKKAADEAEKARKKAEADALTKNQEWQKLAESRQTEIDDLTNAKTELEPFKDQAEKYKKALDSILAAQKKDLPKHIVELLEKMDPVEAMEYITKHAKDLGVKPSTYSETPDGKEKKVSDDDKKEAQKAADTVITRVF
ncbi:MAG: hypothetical protein ACRD2L_06990 [Terriglobia bacterium]